MSGNQDPIIVLVEPQLGENIGMCARAMLNCGLKDLRLVNPREGWPQEKARSAAADADCVIDEATVFDSIDEAIEDCHRVFATTARERSQTTPVLTAEQAASELRVKAVAGERSAILFGPEASGLDGDSISRADTLVRFPTNPEFSSLNLAQAVLLMGWEWRRLSEPPLHEVRSELVERKELDNFLQRLNDLLERRGFFLTEEMKPHTEQALRAYFAKSLPTDRELKLLHGVLSALIRE